MIVDSVYIVSNWCNLRCPQCLQDAGSESPDEVSADDVMKFLDTFPHMESFKVTGGEPLGTPTYAKTYRLVEYALNKGWSVQINTNGTYDIPNFLPPNDKLHFQVSLDGLKDAHDEIRGKGNFDKTVKFIRTQLDRGYNITVTCVIMNQFTMTSLEKFIDFVTITLGVELNLLYVQHSGRGIDIEVLKLNYDAVWKLVYSRPSNSSIAKCQLRDKRESCLSIHGERSRVGIDELGRIIPCPPLSRYKFGTIYDYDEDRVKREMHDKILNCTCAFPDRPNKGEC